MNISSCLKVFLHNQKGAAIFIWALALPILLGFIGLAVDTTYMYSQKSELQNATDAAALAATYAIGQTGANSPQNVATNEMARNGFTTQINSLTVSSPAVSGSFAGDASTVEIVASIPATRFFSGIISSSPIDLTVRSVASKRPPGNACVLALDSQNIPHAGQSDIPLSTSVPYSGTNISASLFIYRDAIINAPNCVLASNVESPRYDSVPQLIHIIDDVNVTVDRLYSAGTYFINPSATVNTTNPNTSNGAPISDQFQSLPIPNPTACDRTNVMIYQNTGYPLTLNENGFETTYPSGEITLNPGTYCGAYLYVFAGNVKFNPGVYILHGAYLRFSRTTIDGSGVTFIFMPNSSNVQGGFIFGELGGDTNISLSAPTTGPYKGILFYQPAITNHAFIGAVFKARNSDLLNANLTGVLYFPAQIITVAENMRLSGCPVLVGGKVALTENSIFNQGACPAWVPKIPIPGGISLVE